MTHTQTGMNVKMQLYRACIPLPKWDNFSAKVISLIPATHRQKTTDTSPDAAPMLALTDTQLTYWPGLGLLSLPLRLSF